MSSLTYVDTNDVKNVLGVSLTDAEDTLLQSFIERAVALIDMYTGRKFGYTHDEIEYVDGKTSLEWWYVHHTPLISVSEITLNKAVLNEDSSFWVYPEYGCIRFLEGSLDNVAPRNVKITYDWGYTSVPDGIKHCCITMVINAFNNYRANYMMEGVVAGSIASLNIQFDRQPMLTEEIKSHLNIHRESHIGVV